MENSLLHLALLLIFAKLAEGLANRTGNSPLAASCWWASYWVRY